MILDDSLAVPEAVEEDAQRRDIEAALIDRVELSAHGLLGLDRKGAVEGAARGDDVKLLVEHDERLANGVDDAVGIGPRCLDCPFGRFPLGYVGEGDNHPRNLGVLGAVGQNATGVPRSVVGLDLAVRRHMAGKNRPGVREQASVVDAAGQVGERPADVGGDDAEQRLGRRREEADVEVAVQEQRRDAGAVQDVLQVVGRAALAFERFLKLTVEGGELFVERLQLLPRGHQLFVGRLELLIRRHGFLVDRLLLLVGDLEFVDSALQLLPGGVELPLELCGPREVIRAARPSGPTSARVRVRRRS